MNRSKIEWVLNPDNKTLGYTWNPVTGCLHGCTYCYARRIARRFGKTQEEQDSKPVFHPERLNDPARIKKPSTIFVCSMADLFGDWVPMGWIEDVLQACKMAPQHRYIFLTKNPERYREINVSLNYDPWPLDCLKGATSEGVFPPAIVDFVSFEPLLEEPMYILALFKNLKWIIVGGQSGPGAIKPKPEWVKTIISISRQYNIPLFLKDNLNWPEKIQEVPWGHT